jgi:hypothetical protein
MFNLVALIYLLTSRSYAANFDQALVTISNQCPEVKLLVIKKSLIELHQNRFCGNTFTTLLLKECPQVTCSSLQSIADILSNSKSGAVIGR